MKTITLTFLLILSTTSIFSQFSDFNFVGNGARALGMGNAFLSIADDASAITWNPAGLSQLRKAEISISFNYLTDKVNYYDIYGYDINSFYRNSKENGFGIDYLGIVYPILLQKGTLSFGISLNSIYKKKYEYITEYSESGEDYSLKSFSFATSYQYKFIHIGLTFNKYFSLGDGFHYDYEYNGYNYNVDYRSKTTGYNFTLGLLFNVETLNTKLPLKIALRAYTPYNLTENQVYSGRYSGSVDKISEFPLIFGIGTSYRFGDYFTLSIDYDFRPMKDKNVMFENNSVMIDTTLRIYNDYNMVQGNHNMNQFRIGAEYIFSIGEVYLPIRIGYKNNPTDLSECICTDYEPPNYTKQIFAQSFNLGLGIKYNFVSINLAYEYYSFDRSRDYKFIKLENEDRGYKYKVLKNKFRLSAIFYL